MTSPYIKNNNLDSWRSYDVHMSRDTNQQMRVFILARVNHSTICKVRCSMLFDSLSVKCSTAQHSKRLLVPWNIWSSVTYKKYLEVSINECETNLNMTYLIIRKTLTHLFIWFSRNNHYLNDCHTLFIDTNLTNFIEELTPWDVNISLVINLKKLKMKIVSFTNF